QVAVGWREERRPLHMGTVVRAAARHVHHAYAELVEHLQQGPRLLERVVESVVVTKHAEAGRRVAGRLTARLANSVLALPVRLDVEGRQTDADRHARHARLDALDGPPWESQAVLDRSPVLPGPVLRTDQFVAQVAVAELDVDELKPGAPRAAGRSDELVDQPIELVVGHDRCTARHAAVEHRMR